MDRLRSYVKLHTKENMDALDEVNWNAISDIKFNVMKDTLTKKSLFTKVRDAIENKDYQIASKFTIRIEREDERYRTTIYAI